MNLTEQLTKLPLPSAFSKFTVFNENINDSLHIFFVKFEHPRGHLRKLRSSHHTNTCHSCAETITPNIQRFVLYNAKNTPSSHWCMSCATTNTFMQNVLSALPNYRGHNLTREHKRDSEGKFI